VQLGDQTFQIRDDVGDVQAKYYIEGRGVKGAMQDVGVQQNHVSRAAIPPQSAVGQSQHSPRGIGPNHLAEIVTPMRS